MDTELQQKLNIPSAFEFPFEPYSIQNDFMKNLYGLLEEGKLGIFESPTGTGKSLSIICGALRWLQDHEARERSLLDANINLLKDQKKAISSADDDWLNTQSQEIEITKTLHHLQLEREKINKTDEKISKLKSRKKTYNKEKLKWNNEEIFNKEKKNPESDDEANDEFLLEDNLDIDLAGESDSEDEAEDVYEGTKIFICSRTHSQIAQLVNEVKRSPFAEDIRLVSLASRQNYCVNSNVNKLRNAALMNEKCLDLQRSSKGKSTSTDTDGRALKKKKSNCQCPYMQRKSLERLRESVLLQIQDVEELVVTGKKVNACPYYAARSAIADAQVILLPYNMILHKSTREASGIKLKNNIVIIDEAHNLLEALADMHSAQINGYQLLHAHTQLTEYRNKYKIKFTAQNLLFINQLLFIIGKLISMLGGKQGCSVNEQCKETNSKLYTLSDFVMAADIDHLNLYKLLKFCSNSKISQKLNGFSMKYQATVNINENKQTETGIKAFLKEISKQNQPQVITQIVDKDTNVENAPRNSILIVIAFLEALTNKCEDGRIVCVKQITIGKGFLKYLLLNPSIHFETIVTEARSVLVAGGTMQPMSEFRDRLFITSGASPNRILEFSCDHIVPPENILPIALASGPVGHTFDFSYESRASVDILNEVGRVFQNICSIVPGGIVCFFPSYEYEKLVYNNLEQTKVLEQLSLKKQIFREPKLSSDADKILTQYSRAIKSAIAPKNGALLFSVVGGKLSEGLNFSDDLGRCIVVVGLPYPNIKSLELQEKMSYLNKNEGSASGNAYYENLCMKAVNQCIGRAVRHRNDYACVILLDKRYSRPKTQQALPVWIQRSLKTCDTFGPAYSSICKTQVLARESLSDRSDLYLRTEILDGLSRSRNLALVKMYGRRLLAVRQFL